VWNLNNGLNVNVKNNNEIPKYLPSEQVISMTTFMAISFDQEMPLRHAGAALFVAGSS
jgi:hypothetical protein